MTIADEVVYTKLDPEFKAEWTKALRSGNYHQTVCVLRKRLDKGKLGYCCLGVACNLIDRRGWKSSEFNEEEFDWKDSPTSINSGFPFLNDATSVHLTTMNDDEIPFTEIADWIEANL